MMFKRFIVRLLILLQIYGNLFQGVAHGADLADCYPIRNEIHLRSTINKYGDIHLALGTDNESGDLDILETVDIPGLLKPLKMVTEVDEETLSECSDLSTDDELEASEQSLNATKLNDTSTFEELTIQGLRISISNTGAMTVQGSSRTNSKPIFLSSSTSITLDNLQASALKITAPRMVNHGTSTIDCLRLGTLDRNEESAQKFINYGNLTAKELFLNNLDSDNHGTIAAFSCGIYGAVEYAGAMEADRLILTKNSALKFTQATSADIKALFLEQASHLENSDSADRVNIDVLDGVGGSLTNLGTMAIGEVSEDSAFQAITNRHWMGVGNGDVNTDHFANSGIFGLKQGSLVVDSGTNSGSLTFDEITVATEFTNDEDGIVTTSTISGEGELINQGKIATTDPLELGLRQLTNHGSLQAQTITGLDTLQKLTNDSEARIDAEKTLSFTKSTQVINDGVLAANTMTLVGDQTSQNGNLIAKKLDIVGGGTFENFGEIDAEQAITLALTKLINRGSITSPVLHNGKEFTRLENTNGAVLDLQDGILALAKTTLVVNHGVFKAKEINLFSDQTTNQKSGKLEATIITLTGAKPFTNSGTIIASQKLKLDLASFTNEGLVQTPLIDISKLTHLTNAKGATIDTKGSNLNFNKAVVVNDGSIKAADYAFKGGSLTQNGNIEGKSLKTTDGTTVTTTDRQTMNLIGELQSDSAWSIRGLINAQKFSRYGDLDLFGTLNLTDSFHGRGTVHKGGKLIAKHIDFYNDATVNGDLESDTINCDKSTAKFTLNGKALVKQRTTLGGLFKVGKDGVLQGHKNHELSLSLGANSEITGLVDVDHLDAAEAIQITGKGKLVSRKQTKLKANLEISAQAIANLHDLKIDGFKAITNNGELQLNNQGKSAFTLLNNGKTRIEAINSLVDRDAAIAILLKNAATGHLTINKGTFDLSRSNGSKGSSENAGTFVDNTSCVWFGRFKNTGLWTSPSSRLLFDYSGQDMGNYQVNGELTVNSLVDGIKALNGLAQTQAKKVIVHSNELKTTSNKKYHWPLELHINGDIHNSFEIRAPELSIYCRNLKTTGDLLADDGWLWFDIEGIAEINARVGGNSAAFIRAKQLKVLGKAPKPGATAPEVIYQRNRNGIYSKGTIDLDVKELIDNHHGVIQGASYRIKAPRLINRSGWIEATEPMFDNLIDVKAIENIRDEPDSYQVFSHKQGNCSYGSGSNEYYCSNCGGKRNCEIKIYKSYPYEASNEGVIISKGNLRLTYDHLTMLASRVTCGGNLTFEVSNQRLVYKNGDLPPSTTMTPRHGHLNHIVAKKDIRADLGAGDITCYVNAGNIFLKAATLALKGMSNQPQQPTQAVNLSSQTIRSAPFETKANIASTILVLGEAKKNITLEDINNVRRVIEENRYTLYRGIDGLGLNPDQFFNYMFTNLNEHVRSLEGTESQICSFTSGAETTQIEVLTNARITKQNLLDLNQLAAFIEMYAQNINALESEQKVNATVYGIFPGSRTDGVQSRGNIDIITQNDHFITTNVRAEKDLNIIAIDGNSNISSNKQRHQDSQWSDNYYETLDQTTIEARGRLQVGGNNLCFNGINTKSGDGTYFEARENIQDCPVPLVSQSISYNDGWNRDKWVHQVVSSHQSDGNIVSQSGGTQELYAPVFDSKKAIKISGNQGVNLHEVHDTHEHESQSTTDGGLFGGTKTSQTNSFSSYSKGSNLTSIENSEIISGQDINATNVSFNTHKVDLKAVDGVVRLLQGTNHASYSHTSSSSNAFWQSQSINQQVDKTFSTPKITGNIEIHSKETVLQQVRGQALEYANRIDQHGGNIITEILDEYHFSKSESVEEPTAAFAAVVAIGISLATANTGSYIGLAFTQSVGQGATLSTLTTTGTILHGMTSVAFTSICSQAGVALLQANGDIGKAAKALSSPDSLKNLALAISMGGVKGYMGPSTGFMNDFASKLTQNTIDASLRTAVLNEKFNLTNVAINAGIDSVAKLGAGHIGDLYDKNNAGFTRDASHFGLGSLTGGVKVGLSGGKFEDGLLPGGFGGMISHKIAEGLSSNGDNQEQRNDIANIANVSTALLGFGLGMNPNIVHKTATNALENNWLAHPGDRQYLESLGLIEEKSALGEGEKETDLHTQRLEEGIELYTQAIAEEIAIQKNPNTSTLERAASNIRETAIRLSLRDTCNALTFKETTKAGIKFVQGEGTTKDRQMLVLSLGTLASKYAANKSGGSKVVKPNTHFKSVSSEFTQTLNKTSQPYRIKQETKFGDFKFGKGKVDKQLFQEHHIISNKHKATKNHDLIELAGFDLESRSNKMLLPTKKGSEVSTTVRSIHDGKHTKLVSERLAKNMKKAADTGQELGWNQKQYQEKLVQIINNERSALKSGDRILNKNHRPFATDGGRVMPRETQQ